MMEPLASRMRETREAQGLSYDDLVVRIKERTGVRVGRQTLINVELHDASPMAHRLIAICVGLGTSADHLLGNDGEVPSLPKVIKDLRERRLGMTQVEFAEELGVAVFETEKGKKNSMTVSEWERGLRPPAPRTMAKIIRLGELPEWQTWASWGRAKAAEPADEEAVTPPPEVLDELAPLEERRASPRVAGRKPASG